MVRVERDKNITRKKSKLVNSVKHLVMLKLCSYHCHQVSALSPRSVGLRLPGKLAASSLFTKVDI